MDETPCYFDVPRSTTYNFSGVQTVKVATTGHEKLIFTAFRSKVMNIKGFQTSTNDCF